MSKFDPLGAEIQSLLRALSEGPLKIYKEYDVAGRTTFIYEAPTSTAINGPCLRTQYTYDGVTNRIQKAKETVVPWLSGYEI